MIMGKGTFDLVEITHALVSEGGVIIQFLKWFVSLLPWHLTAAPSDAEQPLVV